MADETNLTPQNSKAQPPLEPLKQKHLPPKVWVPVLVVGGILAVYLIITARYGIWPFEYRDLADDNCPRLLTPARDIKTGKVRNFPGPCDVPYGWKKLVANEVEKETDQWMTFHNEDIGFTFRYPPYWEHIPGGITFDVSTSTATSGPGIFKVSIHKYDEARDEISEKGASEKGTYTRDALDISKRSLEDFYHYRVDGEKARKEFGYDYSDKSFYDRVSFFRGRDLIQLTMTFYFDLIFPPPTTEKAMRIQEVIDDIKNGRWDEKSAKAGGEFEFLLYSFKFLKPSEETDTSDWQIYRNEEFGFEFKYPQNLPEDPSQKLCTNDGYIGPFFYRVEVLRLCPPDRELGVLNFKVIANIDIEGSKTGEVLDSSYLENFKADYPNFSKKEFSFNGINGIKVDSSCENIEGMCFEKHAIIFIKPSTNFVFELEGDPEILSTFKFIE